jgi:hypothetical protein
MGKVIVVFILDEYLSALLRLEAELIVAAYVHPPPPSFDTIEIIYLENLYYISACIIDMDNIDTGPGLSPYMPCLFTAGLLSWALSLGKGTDRNIRFSQKVLTRFSTQKYA